MFIYLERERAYLKFCSSIEKFQKETTTAPDNQFLQFISTQFEEFKYMFLNLVNSVGCLFVFGIGDKDRID